MTSDNKYDYKEKQEGFITEYMDDIFFDSLRNDYVGFNNWYKKSIDDVNKRSHYWLLNGKVDAFIGFKIEEEEIKLNLVTLPKIKRIKITTIKSNNNIEKFSEFVIYHSIRMAKDTKINEIYFSVITNETYKIKLSEIAMSYGFETKGSNIRVDSNKNKLTELFLFKTLPKKYNSEKEWKWNYPIGNVMNNMRFLVINEKFHDNYIQNVELIQLKNEENRFDYTKFTIQKSYVHSNKRISLYPKNNAVWIYRQANNNKAHASCITGIGYVLRHAIIADEFKTFDSFKKSVKNTHGFQNEDELKKWYSNEKYLTTFVYIAPINKHKPNYLWLSKNGIFNKYPTEIVLTSKQFQKISKYIKDGDNNE